jgi:PAS domain S-box-containing protein
MSENSSEELTAELRSLKETTAWSWERLSREFQDVMGEAGPSMTTLYRYAKGNVKRRNVMMERYVQEAIQKVRVRLVETELGKSEEHRKHVEAKLKGMEERFRRLVENAQDIIYWYSLVAPRGIEYVSPVVTKLTGYTPEEYYADPDLFLKMVHPNDQEKVGQAMEGNSQFREPVSLRYRHKEGRWIWVERVHVPVYDELGDLVALEGIARDITHQRETEAMAAHLAAIIESSNEAIISSALDGAFVSWNPAAERLLGYTAEEMIGKTAMALHPENQPSLFFEMIERLLKGERLEYPDTVRIRKDGQSIRVSVHISPIKNDDGEITGFSGIVREIPEDE